jgi:hypothetical protein
MIDKGWQNFLDSDDYDDDQVWTFRARATKFLRWPLIFVGPSYGTCFMSPCSCLEFSGGSRIYGKFVHPWYVMMMMMMMMMMIVTMLYIGLTLVFKRQVTAYPSWCFSCLSSFTLVRCCCCCLPCHFIIYRNLTHGFYATYAVEESSLNNP